MLGSKLVAWQQVCHQTLGLAAPSDATPSAAIPATLLPGRGVVHQSTMVCNSSEGGCTLVQAMYTALKQAGPYLNGGNDGH